ncbi:hypothetical protein GCM10027052_26720 [Parafrigoribacterium mesophilum]
MRFTCVAVTVTAPLPVYPVPEVPSRAMTTSSTLTTRATTGVIAVPPAVPPSAVVTSSRKPNASTLSEDPPVSAAPSSAPARTALPSMTCRATDAPMPVADPTSALPEAFARSRSLLCAEIVTAPPVRVAEAPGCSSASVVLCRMLMARAPAMPTLVDLLAPARAVAVTSCSHSRNSWSAAGAAGKWSPVPIVAPVCRIHWCWSFRL